MKTKLLYMKDALLKVSEAKIVKIDISGKNASIVLNQTIFYPQGGGQPSDQGTITGSNGCLSVKSVSYANGSPVHQGKIDGLLEVGETVTLAINWDLRYTHMQAHTAGHLLDEAVKEILPEYHGVEGSHGINDKYFIEFEGIIDETHKNLIEETLRKIIDADELIKTRMITHEEITKENIYLPFKLPENKPLRIITIGDRMPVPDGGTQLSSTGEVWPVILTNFEYDGGKTTIHYNITAPSTQQTKVETEHHEKSTTDGISLTKLQKASAALLDDAKKESNWSDATTTKYLGRNGLFNAQLGILMKDIAKNDRPEAGKILNATKKTIEELSQTNTKMAVANVWIDLTAPGEMPVIGHLHPITQAIAEITQIFKGIGFTRVRYPEVDYDRYVFEGLNMPANHPARDEWETFFLNTPSHPQNGGMVLTTHTSNGQVREMERVGKPPIRMLNLGKCYRRQQDVTHTAMFHQFEGLVIDKGITIQHLKGTLDYFAKKFYGPTAKSRIRPFMFKFTEPSFEVDFSCTHCEGTGKIKGEKCRFCKSGWHEVGGAGMVHPNVLKAGGIDSEEYTGFAFGWGVERVYTLKPGLHLDDIRPLYSTNLQFLNQF